MPIPLGFVAFGHFQRSLLIYLFSCIIRFCLEVTMMITRSQSRLPSLSVIYRHLSQQTSSNSKRRPFKVLNDTAVDKDSKEFARNAEWYTYYILAT